MPPSHKTPQETASVGRPRASTKETSGDSRRDILTAAGKLFRTKGYGGTSLREIGDEAGLRKASLYYYFKSKDDILASMIEEVMAPPLRLIEKFENVGASPAAKLWAFLYVDSRQLCEAPYDYAWFLTVAETRTDRFQFFWDDRNVLLAWIEQTIRDGQVAGDFCGSETNLTARATLSLDEFAVNWMAGSGKNPAETAEFVADYALNSLLLDRGDLASVRQTGLKLAGG